MTLRQLTARARRIRNLYAEQEVRRTGRAWSPAELAQGFAGDLGDLMKLVMAKEGRRISRHDNLDAALEHELADCLWSVLCLADAYGLNLEKAFLKTMTQLETQLTLPRRTKTARKSRVRRG